MPCGGFQLAQLVNFLVVEQGPWVQIPPKPKTNWCLDLMGIAIIMSGRHRFKYYRNYPKKKNSHATWSPIQATEVSNLNFQKS